MRISSKNNFFIHGMSFLLKELNHELTQDIWCIDGGAYVYFIPLNTEVTQSIDIMSVNIFSVRKSINPVLMKRIFMENFDTGPRSLLSSNEKRMLQMKLDGFSVKGIGLICNFTDKKISLIKNNAIRKLGMRTINEFYFVAGQINKVVYSDKQM